MDKKKLLLIGGAVLAAVVIIIILLILPKGNNIPVGGSYIVSATLAKSEDKDKNPVNPTEVFSVNDPEIHMLLTYQNLPSGSNIVYQWVDLGNNKVLKEDKRPQVTAIFSGKSSAVLARDQNTDWGMGEYEFRVLLNNKIYYQKKYVVKTEAQMQKEKVFAGITSIQLTTAVDLLGKPAKAVTNIFSKEDENIYASITYQNIPIKTEVEARWKYEVEDRLINTYQKSIIWSGVFAFNINAKKDSWIPIKKWPAGKYQLEIYLNGDLFKTIEFSVE